MIVSYGIDNTVFISHIPRTLSAIDNYFRISRHNETQLNYVSFIGLFISIVEYQRSRSIFILIYFFFA